MVYDILVCDDCWTSVYHWGFVYNQLEEEERSRGYHHKVNHHSIRAIKFGTLEIHMFTIGVFAIIFDKDKRVLLCHRKDYDLWNLPGGGLEVGEVPWEGVRREVKEEVGIDIRVVKLQGIYSKPDKNEVVFSFICEHVGGEIALSDEADKISYFAFDDFPQNTSPRQVDRIKDALENDDLILKVQTGPSSIEQIKQGRL